MEGLMKLLHNATLLSIVWNSVTEHISEWGVWLKDRYGSTGDLMNTDFLLGLILSKYLFSSQLFSLVVATVICEAPRVANYKWDQSKSVFFRLCSYL